MTLRIERTITRGIVVIRLIGQLGAEHLEELKTLIIESDRGAVLDLEEVDLIDVQGVRFLVSVQRDGIEVRNVCPYIREWVNRARGDKSEGS